MSSVSITNRELLNKNILTSDFATNNGLLNPEQGNAFISLVFALSGMDKMVKTHRFTSKQKEISKLDINTRIVFPKTEGIPTGKRAQATPTTVTLDPFRFMAVVGCSYEMKEQSIARGNFTQFILEQAAKQVGNNLETFNLHANTLGPSQPESLLVKGGSATKRLKDPLLAQRDGWLRDADVSNIYDANDEHDVGLVIANALNVLPEQYQQDMRRLKVFGANEIARNYAFQLSERATVLGDRKKEANINAVQTSFGLELMAMPLFTSRPITVEHVTLTGTTPVNLAYKNLVAAEVFVNLATLDSDTAETPFVDTTDYIITNPVGLPATIERAGGSTIPSGTIVKVTYKAPPELLLTEPDNLLIGINTETIRIEEDQDKDAQMWYYYLSGAADVQILNTDAMVKIINLKSQLQL